MGWAVELAALTATMCPPGRLNSQPHRAQPGFSRGQGWQRAHLHHQGGVAQTAGQGRAVAAVRAHWDVPCAAGALGSGSAGRVHVACAAGMAARERWRAWAVLASARRRDARCIRLRCGASGGACRWQQCRGGGTPRWWRSWQHDAAGAAQTQRQRSLLLGLCVRQGGGEGGGHGERHGGQHTSRLHSLRLQDGGRFLSAPLTAPAAALPQLRRQDPVRTRSLSLVSSARSLRSSSSCRGAHVAAAAASVVASRRGEGGPHFPRHRQRPPLL